MDYYELLLQAIYHQIALQKWSIDSLHSKAKSTISTGAVVLSIVAVAMAGFAALLYRPGLDPLALPVSIFGALSAPAIGAVIGGISSIIGSMIVSIRALRGRRIDKILSSREFELIPKGESKSPSEESRRVSSDELAYKLQHNGVDTVRTLEKYNDWVEPRVHAGQILLLLGIGLMSAVPVIGLVWALLSRVPA
ncbi:MAG: hypothetical protein OXU86_06140 [Thaumarchaeota archaeon]|nr:hypothetical protein [Nitrososphaerota archaeon]